MTGFCRAFHQFLNRLFATLLALLVASYFASAQQVGEEASPEDGSLEEGEAKVAALLDDNTTKDMHDDTTLLRTVRVLDDRGLVLFDALRIWVGGALQYDYYNFDGIFNTRGEGDRREGAAFRRFEGILRSQLYDWGELKVQYDFDQGLFKDFYVRWVSDRPNTPVTVTIGNQKEPMSFDNLLGNKFEFAQERAAPTHAFGAWRSVGVRLHKAFQLSAEERTLDIFDEDTSFMTTSIGVFTDDLESTNDTDLAVTGRVTGGRYRGNGGVHFGLSGSYREGEFSRISFRPEVREADRVVLARPNADTQAIIGGEAAFNYGRLHVQSEAFYAELFGDLEGYGAGGYLQIGSFLTQDSRKYNPRWGVLVPHHPAGNYSVEVFARASYVRGDDDQNGWNDYKGITLGGNFYYRKAKGSLNVLYGESREPVVGEQDGVAIVMRAQYLF
jgi:phosphate-selective porin